MSTFVTFSGLDGVQWLCSAVLSRFRCLKTDCMSTSLFTVTHPEQVLSQPKHPNTGRGRCVSIHSHQHTYTEAQKWWLSSITFLSVYILFFSKILQTPPLKLNIHCWRSWTLQARGAHTNSSQWTQNVKHHNNKLFTGFIVSSRGMNCG